MATALGLDEIRSHALNNIGTSRVDQGDRAGIRDLELSIRIATELGSPASARGYNNLFSNYVTLGSLDKAAEAVRTGVEVAERFGEAGAFARWLRFERIYPAYWEGRWDESAELVEETFSELGRTHALSRWAFEIRGRMRLAKDDVQGAVEDAEASLPLGRQAKDPQTLIPALSFAAVASLAAGRVDDAERLADELLARDVAAHRIPHHVSPVFDLAWVLIALGRSAELVEAVDAVRIRTPWMDAAAAIARGEYLRAADRYAEIGARPNEAYTRLRAVAQLVESGRRAQADEQLQKALAFWRSVGATRYIREGKTLLTKSA